MTIQQKLKQIIIEDLSLEGVSAEDIQDDDAIFGDTGLGLDSLDAVEIVVLLQRNFGIEVNDMAKGKEIFYSLDTLVNYIYDNMKRV